MGVPIGGDSRDLSPDEVLVTENGKVTIHKRACAIPMVTGIDCTCRGAMANSDARRGTTWRGDSSIHTQIVIDQMLAMGESTQNADNEYIGLTHVRLVELLKELQALRDAKSVIESAYHHLDVTVSNVGHVLRKNGLMK